MKTSSNGNIFHATGPLCGESTGGFSSQRPATRSFEVFLDLRLNKRLSKESWGWWFETASRSLWRHGNDSDSNLKETVTVQSNGYLKMNFTYLFSLEPRYQIGDTIFNGWPCFMCAFCDETSRHEHHCFHCQTTRQTVVNQSTTDDIPCASALWRHALRWRHNGPDSVSNHQPYDCLLNRLFRRWSKKSSKILVTGLCAGIHRRPVNSPHKGPVTRNMFPFDDVIMD